MLTAKTVCMSGAMQLWGYAAMYDTMHIMMNDTHIDQFWSIFKTFGKVLIFNCEQCDNFELS